MKSGVNVTRDNTAQLAKALRELVQQQVLVGIPAEQAPREGEGINNAELGYIHEFGAPEANIPARPFLVPGVESAKDEIAKRYKAGAKAVLEGRTTAEQVHHGVGIVAVNAVKEKITDGPFAPLKPATVAARKRKHKGRTDDNPTPLVDTGQLKASINYVVRPGKGGR